MDQNDDTDEARTDETPSAGADFVLRHTKIFGVVIVLAGLLLPFLTYQAAVSQPLDDNLFTFCGDFALAGMILFIGMKFVIQGSDAAREFILRSGRKFQPVTGVLIALGLVIGGAVGYAMYTHVKPSPVPIAPAADR
jgi:hypothetical protein